MRLWYFVSYVAWIVLEVIKGSIDVARDAVTPGVGSTPAIVKLPLRCRTDLEVTAMASSITITPGTIVLGTASAQGGAPPVLYVHSLYGGTRAEIMAGLHEMEDRLLRVTRGRAGAGAGAGTDGEVTA
ncbi:MAG: Na+/H+ antiporter subunit E [Propionibacteriaceae bacterium]|nr:Na+/H+ antiporter subunit E [Propionibacteriaceae bacterium]